MIAVIIKLKPYRKQLLIIQAGPMVSISQPANYSIAHRWLIPIGKCIIPPCQLYCSSPVMSHVPLHMLQLYSAYIKRASCIPLDWRLPILPTTLQTFPTFRSTETTTSQTTTGLLNATSSLTNHQPTPNPYTVCPVPSGNTT